MTNTDIEQIQSYLDIYQQYEIVRRSEIDLKLQLEKAGEILGNFFVQQELPETVAVSYGDKDYLIQMNEFNQGVSEVTQIEILGKQSQKKAQTDE